MTKTESVLATISATGSSGTSPLIAQLATAAFSAAVAFAFFLLGQALLKAYERRNLHYSTMVALERTLNLQLDQAHLVRCQIAELVEPLNSGLIIPILPGRILENDDLFLELLDIDLTNQLISHRISISRLNSDLQNINQAYSGLRERFMDGSINQRTYAENVSLFSRKYTEISETFETLEPEIIEILVWLRLRLREQRPWLFRLIGRLSLIQLKPLEASALNAERRAFLDECAAAVNPLRNE